MSQYGLDKHIVTELTVVDRITFFLSNISFAALHYTISDEFCSFSSLNTRTNLCICSPSRHFCLLYPAKEQHISFSDIIDNVL